LTIPVLSSSLLVSAQWGLCTLKASILLKFLHLRSNGLFASLDSNFAG
jgi:hypothetical protein